MNNTSEFNTNSHKTFGGYLYLSDFCTDYDGGRNIANRIASDWCFDEQCRKNSESRDRAAAMKEGASIC